MAIDVTESTFDEEVIHSETPVLVDFWAEWCGPCHAIAPVLEKIAEERKDDLKLVKVNIDNEQALSARYGVMSIPTMILFRDGAPAAAAVGAQPKASLERSLGLAAEAAA
jgi:thioredoxin 1